MRFKKGQTATEYLIILAVVIVIALIVVGVLGGIPSIGGGAKSNTASSYWRSAKIGVLSMKVTKNGTDNIGNDVLITLKNNYADPIRINAITLTDSAGESGTVSPDRILNTGAQGTFTIENISNTAKAAEAYSYYLSVNYTDENLNADYTFTGEGNTLDGIIANS